MSTPNYKKATAAKLSKQVYSLAGRNHAEEQDLSPEVEPAGPAGAVSNVHRAGSLLRAHGGFFL